MNDHGLTLIELVVAMTIAGIALAAGYGALTTLVDNRERLRDVSQQTERASAIRHSLVSWLSSARLSLESNGPRYRGIDGERDDLADDEVTFLTSAPTPLGSSDTIVRLFIDRDESSAEAGLTAQFTDYRGVRTLTMEIAPEVTGLDAEYLSRVLGANRWLPSWISSSVLPAAIRLRLTAGEPVVLPALLQLPILVATAVAQ